MKKLKALKHDKWRDCCFVLIINLSDCHGSVLPSCFWLWGFSFVIPKEKKMLPRVYMYADLRYPYFFNIKMWVNYRLLNEIQISKLYFIWSKFLFKKNTFAVVVCILHFWNIFQCILFFGTFFYVVVFLFFWNTFQCFFTLWSTFQTDKHELYDNCLKPSSFSK